MPENLMSFIAFLASKASEQAILDQYATVIRTVRCQCRLCRITRSNVDLRWR